MPLRALKRGRRASERHAHAGAWARWCSSGRVSSLTLRPRRPSFLTPAWECRSCRSASHQALGKPLQKRFRDHRVVVSLIDRRRAAQSVDRALFQQHRFSLGNLSRFAALPCPPAIDLYIEGLQGKRLAEFCVGFQQCVTGFDFVLHRDVWNMLRRLSTFIACCNAICSIT